MLHSACCHMPMRQIRRCPQPSPDVPCVPVCRQRYGVLCVARCSEAPCPGRTHCITHVGTPLALLAADGQQLSLLQTKEDLARWVAAEGRLGCGHSSTRCCEFQWILVSVLRCEGLPSRAVCVGLCAGARHAT